MNAKRLLTILFPLLIASLLYGYLQMPKEERVATGSDKSRAPALASKNKGGEKSAALASRGPFPRLRSDLLERQTRPYPGVRRDLFFSAVVAEPSSEEVVVLPEEPPAVIEPAVVIPLAPPPPPPPTPQEVASQELSRYKFLGFFKKGVKQTIFLSGGGEIFLLRKGDYLGKERKFFVLDISDTTLKLHKEGAGDFSIKLSDQESLAAVYLPEQKKGNITPPPSPRGMAGSSDGQSPAAEVNLPEPPELIVPPDDESRSEDQLQPDEVNNEKQN